MRTGNKLASALLAAALAAGGLGSSAANAEDGKSHSVFIDGVRQQYDQSPVLDAGSILVPLRGIFESLGAEVTWSQSNQAAYAYKWVPGGSVSVILTIGDYVASVNGNDVTLPVQPRIVNGTTMVPLRFISEAMGAGAVYDPNTGAVRIESDQKPLKLGYRVSADIRKKNVYIQEAARSEQELITRLEQAIRELANGKTGTYDDVSLYQNLVAPLYGIDLKLDYNEWKDIGRLQKDLKQLTALMDETFREPGTISWGSDVYTRSQRIIDLARRQVLRMRDKAQTYRKADRKPEDREAAITVRYGFHSYGSMNQQEYDTVMGIVDQELDGYEQRELASERYAPYYEDYLNGARASGNREDRTTREAGLRSAHNAVGALIEAGVPTEEVVKLLQIRSVAWELLDIIPTDDPSDGRGFGYSVDDEGKVRKTHDGREITLSAYDVLVRNLGAAWSKAEVFSALFDTMGYNTMIVNHEPYLHIGSQWWLIQDFKPIDIGGLDSRYFNSMPTFGPVE